MSALSARMERFAAAVLLLAATGCFDFDFFASPVPLVDPRAPAYPIGDREYRLYYRASDKEEAKLSQTGVVFRRKGNGYAPDFLPTAKTYVRADESSFGGASPALALLGGVPPGVESADEDQRRFAARCAGFAFGVIEEPSYVFQFPLSCPPEDFPKTDGDSQPGWMIRVAKTDAGSVDIYDAAAAMKRASVNMFGMKTECDADGQCNEVPKVKDFVDDPTVNRAIAARAVREHESDLRLRLRMTPVAP